jgi:acetylornithine deacetylase/succinyl-diaminopimelate desuccinylase-like protein
VNGINFSQWFDMDQKAVAYVTNNRDEMLEDFRTLLRQPSVSAQGRGIRECASLLERFMRDSGIETELVEEPEGNPVLLGNVRTKKSKRTLLFYGHYDVQPIEPLEEWKSDPFGAEMKDGKIFARGASDSKNNVMALVKMVESYKNTIGELPINLKFLFEGEEEIGSRHLPRFVEENKPKLKADADVCFDGDIDENGRPEVVMGVKGMLYVELHATGSKVDLHSSLAPLAPNPAWRIIWALDSIKQSDERIKVEGWYDHVQKPSSAELEIVKNIPFDEKRNKAEMGLSSLLLDRKGSDAVRMLLFEPTCNVCGFISGYTEKGSKTVLPSKATAKLDFRLVYDQNPDELLEKLKRHLIKHNFRDIELVRVNSLEPSKTPVDAPIARAVIAAAKDVFKHEASVSPNAAGSGPDYLFTKKLGLNSVWAGCASAFSQAHAPNEFELVDDFLKGIEYAGTIMENFART